MIRVAMRAFAALALLSGTVLVLSMGQDVLAIPGPVIDCDCQRPSDGVQPCMTGTTLPCEDVMNETNCTNGTRKFDFPKPCRSTTNLTICSDIEEKCAIATKCSWDKDRNPKCKTEGDSPGAEWTKKPKPTLGNCPVGATKCAPLP